MPRRILAESPLRGEGDRRAWARLRHRGIRTSQERVRGLMRGRGLRAPQRAGHAQRPEAHDGTILTDRTGGETNDSWRGWSERMSSALRSVCRPGLHRAGGRSGRDAR